MFGRINTTRFFMGGASKAGLFLRRRNTSRIRRPNTMSDVPPTATEMMRMPRLS